MIKAKLGAGTDSSDGSWLPGQPQRLARGLALALALALAQMAVVQAQTCVPQNEFFPLEAALVGLDDLQNVALGAYERISPDGRFVLRSFSGKNLSAVSLIELPAPNTGGRHRVFQTPLTNEAFPVQGTWRYLVEIDGSHYTLGSILTQQKAAQPLFKAGMTGFYAAAAEMSSSYPLASTQPVAIRSLSWPNANARGDAQGQGTLTSRTVTVDPLSHRVLSDSGIVNHCADRLRSDGAMYALPMLSVDGTEFAALPQKPSAGTATMRVFGFGDKGDACIPKMQLAANSGKVTFGFASAPDGASGDLVYEYMGQVWWYPRALKVPLNLAPWEDDGKGPIRDIIASAFPGLTRDGRVVYAATWKRCAGASCRNEGGYVVADPYQSNAYINYMNGQKAATKPPLVKPCITTAEVMRQRNEFAGFHGLPLEH
jgi:hypothetical protein